MRILAYVPGRLLDNNRLRTRQNCSALCHNAETAVYCDTDSLKCVGKAVGITCLRCTGDWGFEYEAEQEFTGRNDTAINVKACRKALYSSQKPTIPKPTSSTSHKISRRDTATLRAKRVERDKNALTRRRQTGMARTVRHIRSTPTFQRG